MQYHGAFKDINDYTYSVSITTPSGPQLVELKFTDSPVVITYNNDDLYKPYKCSTCTISLLLDDYVSDLKTAHCDDMYVEVRKDDDIQQGSYLIWGGFVTPNVFSQNYSLLLEEYQLECQDAMSILKYKDFDRNGSTITMMEILQFGLGKIPNNPYWRIYVNDCYNLPHTEFKDILTSTIVNPHNFYDEDDKPMNYLEVIEECLKYYNMTLIPFGDSIYILNYDAIKNGYNSFYYYQRADRNRYRLEDVKTLSNVVNLGANDFSEVGTNLSQLPALKNISVRDELYTCNDIGFDLSDSTKWTKSNSSCALGNKYNMAYCMQNLTTRQLPDGRQFTNTNDPYHIFDYEVVNGNKWERIFLQYGNYDDTKLKFHVYKLGKEIDADFSTINYDNIGMGLYSGSEIGCFPIKYHCVSQEKSQMKDDASRFPYAYVPKVDVSTGLFCILTAYDYNLDKKLNIDLKKFITFKSDSVLMAKDNYILLDLNFRFYSRDVKLPLETENVKHEYKEDKKVGFFFSVKCNNKYVSFNDYDDGTLKTVWQTTPCIIEWPYDINENENVFDRDLKLKSNIDYTLNINESSGVVFNVPVNDDGVIGSQVEITIYNQYPVINDVGASAMLIKDFDVKLLTSTKNQRDTDTQYKVDGDNRVVDNGKEETFKVCTYDNKETNYSSTYYNLTKDKYIDNVFFFPTGSCIRPEELYLEAMMNQYTSSSLMLNCNLHNELLPYSIVNYHFFNDVDFVVGGMENDIKYNNINYTLIEKK
jgi:hypothetical protein